MRPITRNLFRLLSGEKLLPVQFLDLQLTGVASASILRFTDYGQPIRWGGADYTPLSLSRGGIEEILSSENGESPQSTLTISNIDGQIAQVLNSVELSGATATLWLADRRLLARKRDAVVLAQGEIRDPQLTATTLTLQIINAVGLCESISLPRRLWQSECNYPFGGSACTVDQAAAPYTIATTVQDGSAGDYLVVPADVLTQAGNPDDPTDFWANGYILVQSGVAAAQARPISYVEEVSGAKRFHVRYPFLTVPATGDPILIRRGCRKTKEDCKARGNLANFGGFPDVPKPKFKPVDVGDPRD
jgi:phage-related protein